MASTSSVVHVDVRPEGYAIVTLTKEPVNSLDLDAWQQLEQALDRLEQDPSVSGVIFASGLKRDVFSAGNDIMELYAPKTTEARYSEFWITSNRFLAKLYSSRLATIAAVRGACPAGGCIISMCCDHRVMSSGQGGTIGLNEVQLGIPVPKYWGMLMARLIGNKAADKLLLTGKLVSGQEAKTLGLVDDLVPKDDLISSAEAVMMKLVMLPGSAVASSKVSLRGDFCAEWLAYSQIEPQGAWRFLCQSDTVRTLGAALQRLAANKTATGQSSKL